MKCKWCSAAHGDQIRNHPKLNAIYIFHGSHGYHLGKASLSLFGKSILAHTFDLDMKVM